MRLVPVELSTEEVSEYYEGFSNATLWPLYHDLTAVPQFERRWWEAYREVNRRFADVVADEAGKEAVVWVQDYQLQLVPALLRARRPDLRIGFFNHIPFPGFEIYSRLPWRRQVVEGLLGADLIGFQRGDDAANFLKACRGSPGRPREVRSSSPAGSRSPGPAGDSSGPPLFPSPSTRPAWEDWPAGRTSSPGPSAAPRARRPGSGVARRRSPGLHQRHSAPVAGVR